MTSGFALNLNPKAAAMPKHEMVQKSTLDRYKEESANKLAKLNNKLKEMGDGADGAGPEAGLEALAIGATYGLMARWKVKTPIPLAGLDEIEPVNIIFAAGWPLIRKQFSKKNKRRGDKLWGYGLARCGENIVNRGFDALMDAES